VREMSEGELLQIEKARNLDIEEDVYFEIIRKKTATLIASCMRCGSASAGAASEQISLMYTIGIHAGLAFQIKDDILDFDTDPVKGKPSGVDVKERKMTLPLIYTLNKVSRSERRKLINIVKNHGSDAVKVAELTDRVVEEGGIAYATRKMEHHKNQAIDILRSLPDLPARHSLEQLILFTVNRNS
jgi:octaprenyl-diphosphate synthase